MYVLELNFGFYVGQTRDFQWTNVGLGGGRHLWKFHRFREKAIILGNLGTNCGHD